MRELAELQFGVPFAKPYLIKRIIRIILVSVQHGYRGDHEIFLNIKTKNGGKERKK
jgi:hypothetical protein